MNLTDIYRTFDPKTKEYSFFSGPHRISAKINYTLICKASLNRHKKMEITPYITSYIQGRRLDFNKNRNITKYTN